MLVTLLIKKSPLTFSVKGEIQHYLAKYWRWLALMPAKT